MDRGSGARQESEVHADLQEVDALALLEAHDAVVVGARLLVANDPADVFAQLRAAGQIPTFLLESAAEPQGMSRWTYIGVASRIPSSVSVLRASDPYEALRRELGVRTVFCQAHHPPFVGGVLAVCAYDLVRTVERLPVGPPAMAELPNLDAVHVRDLVAYDRVTGYMQVLTTLRGATDQSSSAYEDAVERLGVLAKMATARDRYRPATMRNDSRPKWQPVTSRRSYEQGVRRVQDYIRAGDAYQVVLSQRWVAACDVDQYLIYQHLRARARAAFMFWLDFGGWQLLGASPETVIGVHDREVFSRPLAGSIIVAPGHVDVAIDELRASEKDRAEHVMLVDLARNDIGRVGEYGSVIVTEFMGPHRFGNIVHLASTVSATLRDDHDAVDALRAISPPGTVTGAPKIRAMEIIDELEPYRRGFYAGTIALLSLNGNLDTALIIRSAVAVDGEIWLQAGGGIVADSTPVGEYNEAVSKLAALRSAVDRASGS